MELIKRLHELQKQRLKAYEADKGQIKEHHGIEQSVLAGGYGFRQILELVQNGADAILEASEAKCDAPEENRIEVRLTENYLIVANTGAPMSPDGLETILRSHTSPKRGNQIGRFGLGFKSLLALKGKIDIFTRSSGNVRFDPERCRKELGERYGVREAPGLRLAWEIGNAQRHEDPVLEDMSWAETIVRAEIVDTKIRKRMPEEIRHFPAEFLLLSPAQLRLSLQDREYPARTLCEENQGPVRILHDGEKRSRWRLFEQEVNIVDKEALADATDIHARDEALLTWALPIEGRREEVGRFWAFFPTQTQTRISGILNAPWKLNNDRTNIIGGAWNTALMHEAAKLVATSLPKLATPEDPARPLDAFPRQLERQDDPAAPLVNALWKAIGESEVIADATGTLRHAQALSRHPVDDEAMVQEWQKLAAEEARQGLVHARCCARQRPSRLRALADFLREEDEEVGGPCLERMTAPKWFNATNTMDVDAAIRVFELADKFLNTKSSSFERDEICKRLRIIPTEDEYFVIPGGAIIAPPGTNMPGRHPVLQALAGNKKARQLLVNVLGVEEYGDEAWKAALDQALQNASWTHDEKPEKWEMFWEKLRAAPPEIAEKWINGLDDWRREKICVQRCDGQWVSYSETLLPGRVIAEDDREANRRFLVHSEHRNKDSCILSCLGIKDEPKGTMYVGFDNRQKHLQRLLEPWLAAARYIYITHERLPHRPQDGYLAPLGLEMPDCWVCLPFLEGQARARLTLALCQLIKDDSKKDDPELKTVKYGHVSLDIYPTASYVHPVLWWLREHGTLATGQNIFPLRMALARRNEKEVAAIPGWPEWDSLFPKDDAPYPEALFPDVQISEEDRASYWQAMILGQKIPEALENDGLADIFKAAAQDEYVPAELPWDDQKVPLGEILVASSNSLAAIGRKEGVYAIALDRDTKAKWLDHGARNLDDLLKIKWQEESGPTLSLTEVVPDLKTVLTKKARKNAACQPVIGLCLKMGKEERLLACKIKDDVLLLDRQQLSETTRRKRLEMILDAIDETGWVAGTAPEALAKIINGDVEERRAAVKNEPDLPSRLFKAVGCQRKPLLKALGDVVHLEEVETCCDLDLAGLVLQQLGLATLAVLKEAFEEEGLDPPKRMSTSKAHKFVASIGFPDDYAISKSSKRDPVETVSGPIDLPPLHDFQVEVYNGIEDLLDSDKHRRRAKDSLDSGKHRRRAVVSLPTGGGKTRVMVEAAVCLVLKPEGDCRRVLWIAQTDELCEQAVQAFRQVWVNLGARGSDLTILRFWGGNSPPLAESEGPIVVVASIQTFNSRYGNDRLEGMPTPGLVVVDECHHAITKSYTNLLRWLGIAGQDRPAETANIENPVIGLSATPFRTDDDESSRLAKRFDNNWLPENQEHLYRKLLGQNVLAKTVNTALETRAGLKDDEIRQFNKFYDNDSFDDFKFLNFLERLNDRMGLDTDRSNTISDYIRNNGGDSILLFANSVLHAETMAVKLTLADIPAVAISGKTSPAARRDFLKKFQRKEIRVLCNHSVLATGFDAPKTDMVLIARQIFSPVRYMQIVGRGLRGEKNGGTKECTIVTVKDNLGRFWAKHPYHYCKQYFERALQ